MNTLALRPWSDDLPAAPDTFPDFVLHRLALAGIGRVEAEAAVDFVPWAYTSRLTGVREKFARHPARLFRPTLARFAVLAGLPPYAGHTLFAVEPFPGWPGRGVHRFSLFLCNEPTMGVWVRLYLYCIDGVWPMPTAVGMET